MGEVVEIAVADAELTAVGVVAVANEAAVGVAVVFDVSVVVVSEFLSSIFEKSWSVIFLASSALSSWLNWPVKGMASILIFSSTIIFHVINL